IMIANCCGFNLHILSLTLTRTFRIHHRKILSLKYKMNRNNHCQERSWPTSFKKTLKSFILYPYFSVK
uniref:Uncharacterized protein n=1 Tax=Poecilia latipinna TaxID=48699 RepID=A0A3B3VXU2_9TELE